MCFSENKKKHLPVLYAPQNVFILTAVCLTLLQRLWGQLCTPAFVPINGAC